MQQESEKGFPEVIKTQLCWQGFFCPKLGTTETVYSAVPPGKQFIKSAAHT